MAVYNFKAQYQIGKQNLKLALIECNLLLICLR